MHPELIKAHIRMAGSSPSKIARECGVCRMTVSQVIHGRGVSKKIAKAISSLTGDPVGDLWPGKYPDLEFIERAGLSKLSAAQAERDLTMPPAPRPRASSACAAVAPAAAPVKPTATKPLGMKVTTRPKAPRRGDVL